MTPVFGLYTHIRSNMIRTVLLILALFALTVPLAFGLFLIGVAVRHALFVKDPFVTLEGLSQEAWHAVLVWAPVLSGATVLWVAFSLFMIRSIVDGVTGAFEIERGWRPELSEMLEKLCISRGMRVPRLCEMPTPLPNAFASGTDPSSYAITVTTGLIELLDPEEMEAVLAHELTHIRNGDVVLMITAGVIAGYIAFWGDVLIQLGMRFLNALSHVPTGLTRFGNSDPRKSVMAVVLKAIVIGVVVATVAGLLARPLKYAVSRRREYLADAGAVELTKNPDALIRALLKLRGREALPGVPGAIREMCFCNPATGFAAMFSTHPAVEDRVDALVRHAGGRLPEPPLGPWGSGPELSL